MPAFFVKNYMMIFLFHAVMDLLDRIKVHF